MNIKIRCNISGQYQLSLDADSTTKQLKQAICCKEGLNEDEYIDLMSIKSGFPPREVKNDFQLKNNDNLIVEIALKPEAVEIKVNSDGSCLFNSLIKALCLP